MYRYLGIVSGLALVVYADILMAMYLLLHATLSLPAIGGAILSIGMAVDANCIIFERIREELAAGKTARGQSPAGFSNSTVAPASLTRATTPVGSKPSPTVWPPNPSSNRPTKKP